MIEAGTRIADRYVVARTLGEGGMGVVYLARDERLAREVAIKMLRASASDAASRRLQREARATSALEAGRVAQVFDAGEMPDGALYVVMEYVQGVTVRAQIQGGRLARDEALRIVRETATTLGGAHRAGLVHRDVKPDNVMLRPDGRVVLLDFGIVKELGASVDAAHASTQLTAAGVFLGTPAYLAPEQALGREVGPASDQFALAVMAFELLTGRVPWVGRDVTSLLTEILGERPRAATELEPTLPPAVNAVLWRAMSKTVTARFATIEAFAAELERAARGDVPAEGSNTDAGTLEEATPDVAAAPPAPLTPPPPAPMRRRWWLAAAASGAVVVVGAAFFALRGSLSPATAVSPPVASDASPARLAFAVTLDRAADPVPARAYAAAMQAVRDGAVSDASRDLDQALAADPSFARAQLAFLMLGNSIRPDAARRYQSAFEHRSTLDPRERVLLAALEPLFRAEPDGAESVRQLRQALEASPDDGDFRYQLARTLSFVGDLAEAVRTFEDVNRRDPELAVVWQDIGYNAEYLGDKERALRAYRTCTALSASASKCLLRLAQLEAKEGMCREAEATSRRAIAIAPDNYVPYDVLAGALDAQGAGAAAVRVAADEALARTPADERPIAAANWRAQIGGMRGDFDDVLAATKEWEVALAGVNDAAAQFPPIEIAVAALIESGRAKEARARIDRYLREVPGWVATGPIDGETIEANGLLRRVGALTPAEWVARRDAWLEASKKTPHLAWLQPAQWWWFAYVEPALTATDARDAIAQRPHFPSVASAPGRDPWYDASLGDVYRFAEQYDEALPYYRRSAASCSGITEPFAHVRSILGLGLTLEGLGDHASACEQYARVLVRWGDARPRSVTAERARTRIAALGCR